MAWTYDEAENLYTVSVDELASLVATLDDNTPETPYYFDITGVTDDNVSSIYEILPPPEYSGDDSEVEGARYGIYFGLKESVGSWQSTYFEGFYSIISIEGDFTSVTEGGFGMSQQLVFVNADFSNMTSVFEYGGVECEFFNGCISLQSISGSDFSSLNEAGLTTVQPFGGTKITSIDLGIFASQERMSNFFRSCTTLRNVTCSRQLACENEAVNMFRDCTSLESVDCRYFNNIINTESMFQGCTSLVAIDISNFTSLTSAKKMFYGCTALMSVDTSNFANVTTTEGTFSGCTSLTTIDASNFSSVTNATDMFKGCSALRNVNNPDFSSVLTAKYMFQGCTLLSEIDTSSFTSVTYASYMFNRCTALTTIDTSGFTSVIDAVGMFNYCTSLSSIDISNLVSLTTATQMFQNCTALSNINLSGLTSLVTAHNMFQDCTSLTTIDTSSLSSVRYAISMFEGCTALEEIKYWGFITLVYYSNMFSGCTSLTNVYKKATNSYTSSMDTEISNLRTFINTTLGMTDVNVSYIFTSDEVTVPASLVDNYLSNTTDEDNVFNFEITDFTGSYLIGAATAVSGSVQYQLQQHLDKTINLLNLTLGSASTDTSAEYCFAGCTNINSIEIVSAPYITDINNIFNGCTGITTFDMSAFTNITDASSAFEGTSSLDTVTGFDIPVDATVTNMFQNSTVSSVSCPDLAEDEETWGMWHITPVENSDDFTIQRHVKTVDGVEVSTPVTITDYNTVLLMKLTDELYFGSVSDEEIAEVLETGFNLTNTDVTGEQLLSPYSDAMVLWAKESSELITNIVDREMSLSDSDFDDIFA